MPKLEKIITTYTKLQYLNFVPEIRLFIREDKNLYHLLQQEYGNNVAFPFWAHTWAGGQALARYILDNPSIVKNKHIVDYCSGSSIVGIAANLSGAKKVTCVDVDELSTTAASLNARANHVQLEFSSNIPDHDLLLSGDPEVKQTIFDTIKSYNSIIGCPTRDQSMLHDFNILYNYNIITNEFPNGTVVNILSKI